MTSLIYHERQRDQLCGVHALNSLLQGPFFSAPDLAAIAAELDAEEQSLLDAAHFAGESENVDASGNFSVQVLSKALDVFGLTLRSLAHPSEGAAREDAAREVAYVCNLERHWFALRNVNGTWWNLNSLATAPKKIGSFYLEAFLRQLEVDGYSIFIVRDLRTTTLADMTGNLSENGRWFTEEEAIAMTSEADSVQAQGRARLAAENATIRAARGGSIVTTVPMDVVGVANEDAELQAALAASMEGSFRANTSGESVADDADLNAAIAASLGVDGRCSTDAERSEIWADAWADTSTGAEPSLAAALAASLESAGADAYSDDPELAAAIAASLIEEINDAAEARSSLKRSFEEELPDEPAADAVGALALAIRLPTGARLGPRRFLATHTVHDVERYLALNGIDVRANVLASAFPPRALADPSMSLAAAGVRDKDILSVRPR